MRSNNPFPKIFLGGNCYFRNFFFGETCARTFSVTLNIFFGAGPGYPFPIFLVAFAPQSHKKGFSRPSLTQSCAKFEMRLLLGKMSSIKLNVQCFGSHSPVAELVKVIEWTWVRITSPSESLPQDPTSKQR